MGKFLQTLGERAFGLKWWGVGIWVAILAILGILTVQFAEPTSSDISIPGTQAQQTLERFNELFPDAGAQSGRIVIAAPEGETIQQYQQQINDLASKVEAVDGVTQAVTPFVNTAALSEDQRIGYITVQIQGDSSGLKQSSTDAVMSAIDAARVGGLTVEAGGDLVNRTPGEFLGVGEIGGVLLALIVLVVTLGSLVAAGLPILIAIVTVGLSMAGLFALSPFIDINSTTPALAVMLGLAVGIDYSLFIVNRYRTFVLEGYDLKVAAGKAIATAGNAVIFAAATVVIALASLSIVNIPFMTTMGLAAAATVATAALVAVTLIPSILGIVGYRIFGRRLRAQAIERHKDGSIHEQRVSHGTIWYRWGETLLKYRKTVLAFSLLIVVALALPISGLRLGLPTDETAAPGSSERRAYDLVVEGFGAGYNAPLLLVVEGLPAVTDEAREAIRTQVMQQAAGQASAAQPMSPQAQAAAAAQLEAQVDQYAQYYELNQVAESLKDVEGVEAVQPAAVTDGGRKGIIQLTPTTGPSDPATEELVTRLRDVAVQTEALPDGTSMGVTGSTALQIDINHKLADALPVYLTVVVGLSLVLLMIAFRSILIPLKATLGFLLSVVAMFGALVAVFQWGWFGITDAPGPIVSFIPIIAIGILFGLAMDYEFFLVSGMQESYHHKKDAKAAIVRGFALGSRVVVAAGLIMVAVFAGFVGNHDATIQSIGFALAIGILVDAFIVRLVIVPIVMSFLGRAAWWLPKWLEKRLPKISIEGES
ncbi:hypothetical protein CMN24_00595 [Candidatus Saccharibacteria bacterium]|nr:hypothetical protein [Candidatus Saccharibacteria bacterium]